MGNAKVFNNLTAASNAIELAKLNIQSTSEWTSAEEVVKFIEIVYEALTDSK